MKYIFEQNFNDNDYVKLLFSRVGALDEDIYIFNNIPSKGDAIEIEQKIKIKFGLYAFIYNENGLYSVALSWNLYELNKLRIDKLGRDCEYFNNDYIDNEDYGTEESFRLQ